MQEKLVVPSVKSSADVNFSTPANDFITISFSSAEKNVSVEVYDLPGKRIFKSSIFNLQSSIKIDMRSFSQVVYVVEVNDGKKDLKGQGGKGINTMNFFSISLFY